MNYSLLPAFCFTIKPLTTEMVNMIKKTTRTLAPVVHTIMTITSGLALLAGIGAGVIGSGCGLEARLLSPASIVANEAPVKTAVATFFTTAPAAGLSGIAFADTSMPIRMVAKSTFFKLRTNSTQIITLI